MCYPYSHFDGTDCKELRYLPGFVDLTVGSWSKYCKRLYGEQINAVGVCGAMLLRGFRLFGVAASELTGRLILRVCFFLRFEVQKRSLLCHIVLLQFP